MNLLRRLPYDNPVRSSLRSIRHQLVGEPVQIMRLNSYSQAGEDRVLASLFLMMNIVRPSYLDIGACRYDIGSNTYLFYQGGSRGVCVEPDPRIFRTFKEHRSEDICVNAAVTSVSNGTMELFLFDDPSMNTMVREEAQRRDEVGECRLVGSVKVPSLRLEDIIDQNCSTLPDFVSLDVEGVDYEILSSFDFDRYPVPVWIVETVDYSPTHVKTKVVKTLDLMNDRGYFVYADTYINTIFVSRAWFENYRVVE